MPLLADHRRAGNSTENQLSAVRLVLKSACLALMLRANVPLGGMMYRQFARSLLAMASAGALALISLIPASAE
ncbi:MAG: hypothetical protein LC797_09205, partial [Chloroflexi bacterium]|nr:hypothetical protein [Chloroflexota bacterium]